MIKFKVTEPQLKQMLANATNASIPVGMGHLHYTDKVFGPEDFTTENRKWIDLDYVQGRMVKLGIHRKEKHFETNKELRADYQSWIVKYPTVKALVESVGGEVVE